jgi:hypothetical protein
MAATILADDGELPRARERFEAALATFREAGNRRSEGAVEHNLAILSRRLRELPQALEHALRAKDLYEEVGQDRAILANTILVIAHVRGDLGLLDEAAAGAQESVELRRKAQHRLLPSALSSLAEVRLLQDRQDEARAHWAEALKVARPDDNAQVGECLLGLGRLALAQGQVAAAVEQLQKGAANLARASRRDESARGEALLIEALLQVGRTAEAQKASDRAQALLAGSRSLIARPRVALAQARLRAARNPDQLQQALAEVESVRAEAAGRGLAEEQLEARAARAELRLRAEPAQAAAELRALAKDARRLGYALLARRAEERAR